MKKQDRVAIALSQEEIVVIITALQNDCDSRREDNSFLNRQCHSEAKVKRDNLEMIKKNNALRNRLEKL